MKKLQLLQQQKKLHPVNRYFLMLYKHIDDCRKQIQHRNGWSESTYWRRIKAPHLMSDSELQVVQDVLGQPITNLPFTNHKTVNNEQ